ncbi:MAG: hypothetical protein GF405_01345 [Candidatus Eisenbacteria bacterium]|nr:hypothetical protein [Candidatus Eisenbacteria bacterium]
MHREHRRHSGCGEHPECTGAGAPSLVPPPLDRCVRGLIAALALAASLAGCATSTGPSSPPDRYAAIPDGAIKVTPQTDNFPPVVHDGSWAQPEPLEGTVNTAGGEDSPYVSPDGDLFLFWFTPDVSLSAEQQVGDGVTGIWVALEDGREVGAGRALDEPTFVDLSGIPSLEGCPTLHGDDLWFCSIRGGNYGEHDVWYAERSGARSWTDWRNAGVRLNEELDVGEWHLDASGETLYFGAELPGGYGSSDLYYVVREGDSWSGPVNLGPGINTAASESRPFVTADGTELWYTGASGLGYHGPAVFRSTRSGAGWNPPVEIISNYAAEPCLDDAGDIYFAHHFMDSTEVMIEADIYVARRR